MFLLCGESLLVKKVYHRIRQNDGVEPCPAPALSLSGNILQPRDGREQSE